MFIARVLVTAGMGVRNPDRRQLQHIDEDVIGKGPAEIRHHGDILAGRGPQRSLGPFYPGRAWISAGRGRAPVQRDFDILETVPVEMIAQRCRYLAPRRTHDKAQLASGGCGWRDGIDRFLWIAGAQREHFERIPAEEPLRRAHSLFAPPGIDRLAKDIFIDPQANDRLTDLLRNPRRLQAVQLYPAPLIHHGRESSGEERRRIPLQTAPVS